MIRIASILAVLYLAIAPGMNVARLVHSLDLCDLFEAEVSAPATACPHHHHEKPDPAPEHDHGHDSLMGIESGAFPAQAVADSTADAPVYLLQLLQVSLETPLIKPAGIQPERPPPIPPLVGVTLLLI